METEPLVGRVPLQPPEAVQVCAPLAFQLKVTGSPEFTLLALTCKEIDGLATAVVAAAASPLPADVRESPSQAAKDEITAHAKSQRERACDNPSSVGGPVAATRPHAGGAHEPLAATC